MDTQEVEPPSYFIAVVLFSNLDAIIFPIYILKKKLKQVRYSPIVRSNKHKSAFSPVHIIIVIE